MRGDRCHLRAQPPPQARRAIASSSPWPALPRLALAWALAAALLGACHEASTRAPFTDSRIPPGLQSRFYPPDGWTWGLVQPGRMPAARYGVSAPSSEARADILILASYGEPAEVWFETASELNAKGYVVWVLEPVGQGGSGRYSRLRDLGYAESLTPDVLAARITAERIIHRRPLILMASGTSASAAIQALAAGTQAEGLILTSPRLSPDDAATQSRAQGMLQRNFGWLRADLHGGWSRHGQDDLAQGLTHDPARGRLRLAWQTANPDLRMGTPSWSWIAAFAGAVQAAGTSEPRVSQTVLVLEPDRAMGSARADCQRMAHCTLQTLPAADRALELEANPARAPWIKAVGDFVEHAISAFAPPMADARLAQDG